MRNSTYPIAAILFCYATVSVADWPQFRGPSTQGVTTAEALPLEWSQKENVAWRLPLPGKGWSSPIVVGDTIYVTSAVESDNREGLIDLELIGIDAESGRIEKRVQLFTQGEDAPAIHQKNSHASPTPVYDGEALYVHFGHQGTARVDLAGQVVWRNDGLGYSPVHGNGGSPVVIDDLLIFSRDGAEISEITALNKGTGGVEWRTERDVAADKKFSFATPLVIDVAGQSQLILPGTNVVQSVDPRNGEEIWRVRYDGYSVIPRPIFTEGLVFICTGYNRPSLLAIDPTGTGDVTESHLRWTASSNIPHTPSLIAYQNGVVMVSDKGIASCLEAATGKEIWRDRIGGNFSASPLLAGSTLYLLSEEGVCTVLDISQSSPRVVQENKLGERALASPAVIDSDLLVRTEQALYRVRGRIAN